MDVAMTFLSDFKPFILGGLMVGFGVGFLYISVGLNAAISPVYASILSFFLKGRFFGQPQYVNARMWRTVFVVGLILGGFFYSVIIVQQNTDGVGVSWYRLLFGGVLIGVGASFARGCLFTHGVCNILDSSNQHRIPIVMFVVIVLLTAACVSIIFTL